MAKRRRQAADSLDLLLDTICNTFGGVLFMAILVVILLQLSGPVASITSSMETAQAEEFVLESRKAMLAAEIQKLQNSRRVSAKMHSEFATEEVRALLSTHADTTSRSIQIEAEQASLNRDVESKQAEIDAAGTRRQQAERESTSLDEKKRSLQQQVEAARKSRTTEIRMPVAKSSTFKQGIAVICRYGRLYVWHKYDSLGVRIGLNTDEFLVTEERADALVTSPIRTAGIPLTSDLGNRNHLRNRLRMFDPRTSYISIVMRPDSFEQFKHLREVLIELGFEYRLMPASEGSPIVDRGGSAQDLQ